MRAEPIASLVWFGDGATSEGDFHEAMNFASVFKSPTVFFCVNNQWAISTPIAKQTATKTLAEKSVAYAMPSARVDGFDPIACWQATHDALRRAREGGGPSFIEAVCYRIGAHGTADDPRLYRDQAEAEEFKKLEPVGRMRGYLQRAGIIDDAEVAGIASEAKETIARAVGEMERIGQPGQEILFDYVYASGHPWPFDDGLRELGSVERPPEVQPLGPPPGPSTGDAEAPEDS
jgi:pyruvate dehydrogenase E1 component alpha subunit/2-oxoisovalerate dehydrogenase E1 component alpha subunit